MKVQVEDISSIEKRLSIEVDFAVVEKELTQAYATLSRQVKMPGFRAGKIPRRLLEQRYKSEVEADVLRRVQLIGFYGAVQEQSVPAVGEPTFTGGKIEAQKPVSYSARVEVRPSVTPKDYKGLVLPAIDATVPDEKVQEQLNRLAEQRVEAVAVEGRDVVQKGDVVTIDFDATIDGAPFGGNTGRDVTVEVVDGQLIEGNLPQLEGAKLKGTQEFDYTFPADYRVEEVKGKTAHFVATIKEIKVKKTPALDDAFAKSLGEDSFDSLKAKVRKDLERAAQARAATDEREAILKALVDKNAFDVPAAMINGHIDFMLRSALNNLMRSGMDPKMLNLDWTQLREEMRPKAVLEVQGQLILEAVAAAESIDATAADVEARLQSLADEAGVSLEQARAQVRNPEAQAGLKARTKEEKVLRFLKEQAKA